jgi:very-short-patch-repair endonuclease
LKKWCNKNKIHVSKLEKKFEKILIVLNIKYETQYQLATKFYDFFLSDYNTLIEIDGDYWHANKKIYKNPINNIQKHAIVNDKIKNIIAESSGRKILRFWEHEINNAPLMVINKLKNELKIQN